MQHLQIIKYQTEISYQKSENSRGGKKNTRSKDFILNKSVLL